MFAAVELGNKELAFFEFGDPVEEYLPAEVRVRRIMSDYESQRDELWSMSTNQAVIALVKLLDEARNDPPRLVSIIRALGFLKAPDSGEVVATYLDHPAREVRLEAVYSIGRIANLATMPRLEPFLADPDREFRRAAIVGLGKSIEPSVLPQLEAAAGGDAELQALVDQARRKIAAIQTRNLRAYVNAIIETDEYYDLIRMLEVTWEHVVEIMADQARSPVVRRRAVRLLYLARVPMAKEPLTKIVAGEEEPSEVRLQAVIGVGRCRAQEAVGPLIKLLDNPDASLRNAAITSLGQIGNPRALNPLLSKWDAGGGALRGMILLAIRRLCATSGTVLLTDLLEQNPQLISRVILFIDDSLALSREYRADYVASELKSPEAEARRDAALLLAFFGTRSDADALALMGKLDPDATNREIALKGYSKLLKSSR